MRIWYAYHLNLPLQGGLPESLKIFSVFPGINRQPLHLHWDDNGSSTVQLHYWPCQHLWHEASSHVQGGSHHWQQERDTWPAWVRTGVPLEQVTCQSQHVWNTEFDLFWKCFNRLSFFLVSLNQLRFLQGSGRSTPPWWFWRDLGGVPQRCAIRGTVRRGEAFAEVRRLKVKLTYICATR